MPIRRSRTVGSVLFVDKMNYSNISDFSFHLFSLFFILVHTLNSIGVANEINQEIKYYTFHENEYISSTERQFQRTATDAMHHVVGVLVVFSFHACCAHTNRARAMKKSGWKTVDSDHNQKTHRQIGRFEEQKKLKLLEKGDQCNFGVIVAWHFWI